MRIVGKLISLCLVIHAYANGGNWRYTVERYACGVESVTTKYEYSARPPADALTREQLERELDRFRHDQRPAPSDDSTAEASQTI